MKKPPQIDLSKVKIGQRVKLRNGEVVKIHSLRQSGDVTLINSDVWRWINGTCDCRYNSPKDIIEILPLQKKKAVKKHPGYAVKPLQWKLKNEKTIRAAIKLLEGLLK